MSPNILMIIFDGKDKEKNLIYGFDQGLIKSSLQIQPIGEFRYYRTILFSEWVGIIIICINQEKVTNWLKAPL